MMNPLYAHCPHCDYPVVVNGIETVIRRRCRQCRREYTPGVPPTARHSPSRNRKSEAEDQRAALRTQVRRRRRVGH